MAKKKGKRRPFTKAGGGIQQAPAGAATVAPGSKAPALGAAPAAQAASPRPTLDQVRLAAALAAHDVVEQDKNVDKKRYKSACESGPMAIRAIGLGPAIAMMAAKDDGSKALAGALARWLLRDCGHCTVYRDTAESSARTLLEMIGARGPAEYRQAQAEAMAYAQWLKRYAQAFLG
jgi:CRISPR-associated protein Cmr5